MQVYSGNGQWITADQIKAQSDAMHETLQPFGYEYINVDAAWNGGMDGYGRPIPSTTLYPNGLQEVIDYVHANGQKFGLYAIPGLSPQAYNDDLPIYDAPGCSMKDIAVQPLTTSDYWGLGYKIDFSNPCAQSYIDSIADLLGAWGVDFLKFDSVTPGSGHNNTSIDARDDVKAWSQALAPHNIWLELSWALDIKYVDTWKQYANGWRVDWDVECYCGSGGLTKWDNIARLFPIAEQWWRHAGTDGWNDFDSMNVGNGAMDGITQDERRTAMTFWSISSAPLYIGNDMTQLDSFGIDLLTNEEVIAVNQAGRPAHPVSTESQQQVWYANNGDGTYTVGLFNLGNAASTVTVNWSDIGLQGSAAVRDLWSHTDLGVFASGYSAVDLAPHASRLFRVTVEEGASAVNDDDTGMKYTGSWIRNGSQQLSAATQNFIVAISDTNAQNSSISPNEGSFDKKAAAQADVITTLTLNGNQLNSIANSGSALVAGTDYIVSGNEVAIKKEYLAARPIGTANLVFSFSGGASQTLSITISDTTIRDSGVTPAAVSFDKKEGAQSDIPTTLQLNGNSLSGVTHGSSQLVQDTDYTITDNKLILRKEYLAAQPTGTTNLVFSFSGGSAQNVALIIKDTSIGGSISLNDDDPSIVYTGAWNRSYNRGLGDYKDDVHYLENNNEYFEYTFTGTGIEMITEMDPSQGAMDIYVDNEFKQTVSTYNLGRLAQQTVFNITGLPQEIHTLKVVKKSGWFLLLDKLRVTVPDLISPLTASFDKAATLQADMTVTSTVYGNNLSDISNGQSPLVLGSDYVVSDNEITIKKEYLTGMPIGTTGLTFSFEGGAIQTLVIEVVDSISQNSTISPNTGAFDKQIAAQSDVTTTMNLNGNTLTSIINNGVNLISGTDYEVAENLVTIKKEYLAGLPVGQSSLRFSFNAGAMQTLVITVIDTTAQNSTISPTTLDFDKKETAQADLTAKLTLNGNDLSSISNGGSALVAGTDYTVIDNVVTIKKSFLATLPNGTINLIFSFTEGADQTLTVIISDTSRGRYLLLNDNDSGISYLGAWQHNRNRGLGDYKDDVHFTETNNDSFEFKFKGTGIEVVTETDSSQGDIDIYVDNEFKQTISTYSASKQVQQTVYNITGLSDGDHTLKAVKKSGYYMLLDQLKIRIADLISPDSASFDKNAQTDLSTTLTIDGSNLLSITNEGVSLVPGTDYTISGNQVTLKKEYLAAVPVGVASLIFSFRGDYQNDVHSTQTNNDSFEFTFTGTGVEWITAKAPTQGDVEIYVDNKLKQTLSLYAASRQAGQTVYSISGLPNGTHTIKGVKKSGDYMLVDQLVYSVAGSTQINDSDSEIKYSGNWVHSTARGFGDYEDDVHYTERNKDYFQYKFKGSGIELLMEKDSSLGEIDIYVDNKFMQTISAYHTSRLVGQTVYSLSGLSKGSHTIKVVKKSGTYMILDSIKVKQ